MDNCKQRIKPQSEKTRQCQRKIWKDYPNDGYCKTHHPDTIEHNFLGEIESNQRRMFKIKCEYVGRLLYRENKELFEEIINERENLFEKRIAKIKNSNKE